jgi:quercetin dioxygenase-like cupin family protein
MTHEERSPMRGFLVSRKRFMLLATLVVAGVTAVAAYAALPTRTVDPLSVPAGTLAGQTSMDVYSVDAFTRAINQSHGAVAVLQHIKYVPGQQTLWHTHPGPNIVLVVGGSLTITDNHCQATTYGDGQGFATGLDVHMGVAGASGADTYSLYFLPAGSDALRTPAPGISADPPPCAS